MFNDISCGTKDNERECLANAKVVSIYAKKFGKGQWSFIWSRFRKEVVFYGSGQSTRNLWDHITEKMLLEFAENTCPIFRATIPLSRGQLKSEGHGKLSIHFGATQETIETIFRIIISANQLSLYGAVGEQVWRIWIPSRLDQGDLIKWWDNQLFSVNSRQKFLWRMTSHHTRIFYCNDMKKRIEMLSQQDKVSKFCMGSGIYALLLKWDSIPWLKTLGEQFFARACREYTLPRSDESSQPKGWIPWKHENWNRIGNYDQLSVWQTWNWN